MFKFAQWKQDFLCRPLVRVLKNGGRMKRFLLCKNLIEKKVKGTPAADDYSKGFWQLCGPRGHIHEDSALFYGDINRF
jgi:hypothetical protein